MIVAAKVDANQKEIVKKLRMYPGVSVHHAHQLKKFCDLVVGFRGANYLFEIKKNKKQKLTEGEKEFQEKWRGQVNTVDSAEEILKIIGLC